jgi:hypothetical protein
MKHKVGDRVQIKSLDWYNENKDEIGDVDAGLIFDEDMSMWCSKTMTILEVHQTYYTMKEECPSHYWTDEMIECKVEEETKPKFKVGDKVKDKNNRVWFIVRVSETFFDISSIPVLNAQGYFVPMEDQDDYELFLDKEYPKTYEECCKVLMGKTDFQDFELVLTKLSINRSEENSISPEPPHISLINTFYKLLICRNAYWKIAGDEMGLGKPWEPQMGVIYFYMPGAPSYIRNIFPFTTPEMRDAFYENFKEEIEICKEFL